MPSRKQVPVDGAETKVDRSKASIFQWDDERLQKTDVVKKKITKSAVKVQRFIRACIQHWKFYNEERLPMLEEMKDIDRRRLEELEEVKNYIRRGFEEAKFELEYELAMPQEEFERSQAETNELKKWIKDEEAALAEVEAQLRDQRTAQKHLEREKHEIEAQHTFARLDVEIPALEAENEELSGVHAQFKGIADDLRYGRLDRLEVKIFLESSHRSRLESTIKGIVSKLESTGKVKPKVIDKIKTICKYKGEEPPPPKPSPPPPPPPPPNAPVAKARTPENVNGSSVKLSPPGTKIFCSSVGPSAFTKVGRERPPPGASADHQGNLRAREPTSTSALHPSSGINDAASGQKRNEPLSKGPTSKPDLGGVKAKSKPTSGRTATDGDNTRGVKKTASSSSSKRSTRVDNAPAAFNWGDLVQPKKTSSAEDDKRGAKLSRRSKSTDDARITRPRDKGDAKSSEEKDEGIIFDWGAFAQDDKDKKHKKKSKDKGEEKSKKTKKSRRRSLGRADDVNRRSSRKSLAQAGHFSFAYLDADDSDSDSD